MSEGISDAAVENKDEVVNAKVSEETQENEETVENGDADDVKQEVEQEMDQKEEIDLSLNEDYVALCAKKIDPSVATEIVKQFLAGTMEMKDFDDRVLEMVRSFQPDHGTFILSQFNEGNMIGVQNKAQYVMAVMRNLRDRLRLLGQDALTDPLIPSPDPASIQAILDRTHYPLEVTVGQRKYGGPAPEWDGPGTGPVGSGYEVYIGHIPKDLFEDSLIPVFEKVGKLWDLRLMMDPTTGTNRGYAFLTFCSKADAQTAAKQLDGHEIRANKRLKVNVSVANTRLFVGNIPKSKTKEDILAQFQNCAEGVHDVIIYTNPDSSDTRKNRGFCFVDFVDHKAASDAKRKISTGKIRPWNNDLVVDWAEMQEEPDEETMSKVKVLYIRNLKEAITEDGLKEMFAVYGTVDRIKKIRDYAFVHYAERDHALKVLFFPDDSPTSSADLLVEAMEELNGKELEGVPIDISLAKPQLDRSKREAMRGAFRGRGQWGFGFYGDSTGFRGGRIMGSVRGYGGDYSPRQRGSSRGRPPFGHSLPSRGGGYAPPPLAATDYQYGGYQYSDASYGGNFDLGYGSNSHYGGGYMTRRGRGAPRSRGNAGMANRGQSMGQKRSADDTVDSVDSKRINFAQMDTDYSADVNMSSF